VLKRDNKLQLTNSHNVGTGICFQAVRLPHLSVCSSGHVLLTRYLVNPLSNLDETYGKYLTAPADDLISFWRLKVKVTVGGEGIDVDAGVLNPSSCSCTGNFVQL